MPGSAPPPHQQARIDLWSIGTLSASSGTTLQTARAPNGTASRALRKLANRLAAHSRLRAYLPEARQRSHVDPFAYRRPLLAEVASGPSVQHDGPTRAPHRGSPIA